MLNHSELRQLQSKGYFCDGMPTATPNNVGMPAGMLAQVSPDIVENILAFRAGDRALGGRKKVLDWFAQEYYLPFVEKAGQTTPYSDLDDALNAGVNVTFGKTGHYLFSSSFVVGEREAQQLAQANIGAQDFLLSASVEALAAELNRVAFNGYASGGSFLVYGLLNNPALNAYEASDKKIADMTYDEVVAFFVKAMGKLRSQTGNNIQWGSTLRVVVSSEAFDALSGKITQFGTSADTELIKKYKELGVDISIIPADELNSANAGQNVIYFILDNNLGGVSDTSILGYSEIARMSNIVVGANYTQQKVSAGTAGAVIYKPAYIVRYTNI